MPSIDQQRADQLLALARARFDPQLRPIEEQVLTHSCRYEDPPEQPTRPDADSQYPELRPGLLRWLLSDPEACALLEIGGLRVWGARLTEPLDLTNCRTTVRLELRSCLCTAPLLLHSAEIRGIYIIQSTLQQGIQATHVHIQGLLHFEDVILDGELQFDTAHIDGRVYMLRTTLLSPSASHSFSRATIQDDLLFQPDFHCAGSLRLGAVRVGGALSLQGATFTAREGVIAIDKAEIQGSVYLIDLTSSIEVTLAAAEIGGEFNCSGAHLNELTLDEIKVRGNVLLIDGFQATGMVRMPDAVLDGQLNCDTARLLAPDTSLVLDGMKINGHILLTSGFRAVGMVRMMGIQIEGQLDCDGAQFECTNDALVLVHAKISTNVFLTRARCAGVVRFLGVEIGGNVDCGGSQFTKSGYSLRFDAAKIAGSVSLAAEFGLSCIGMPQTVISGQLNCRGASSLLLLFCDGMQLEGELLWFDLQNAAQTKLNLADAKIKKIIGSAQSWPAPGNLYVNGLEVQGIEVVRPAPNDIQDAPANSKPPEQGPLDTRARIAWLNLQSDLDRVEPQPWFFLSAQLQQRGQAQDAKRVIFELRRHQATAQWKKHSLLRTFAILFARLEEQPLRIILPILLLTLLSGSLFYRYEAHFAETSDSAYKATHTPHQQADSAYPRFQPYVYALENVLPVIKLGQDDHWAPDPAHTCDGLYRTLVFLRWALILLGWAMGGILAAAVGARFSS